MLDCITGMAAFELTLVGPCIDAGFVLIFAFFITEARPLPPEEIKSPTLEPADRNKSVALDPMEESVFFVPELADDTNPPAVLPKLCAVFPVVDTVDPTVFPTVFTPEDTVFPAV
jgi:hypothetical protein